MWLYTNQGHLSVVEDRNDSNKVIVRARNKMPYQLLHNTLLSIRLKATINIVSI